MNDKEWEIFKNQLMVARVLIEKLYFAVPSKQSEYSCMENTILSIFDKFDDAIKESDKYLLSHEDWNAKYYYGSGIADSIDDHTSVWGGAGPDCNSVLAGGKH